jgi:CheY-like chemotaxis protein
MGGEIGIDEPPGGGSRFWFTLPAVVVKPAPAVSQSELAGLTVAIVTRNIVLRDGLAAQVTAAGGAVFSPQDAKRPDFILVDAGTDSDPNPPASPDRGVPALVLLTPAARTQLPAMREMGFAAYLVKPVRLATLARRLRRLMEHEPGPVRYGDALPVAPIPAYAEEQRAAVITGGIRILLAEDNPINLLLTRELLRRRGHVVVEVTSGEAAVRAMEGAEFDIVLTDIHMPGMDGIEATRAIRAYETATGRRRTPIVALTADALETGKRACKDAGMDGFLTKPVDPAQLADMFNIFFPPTRIEAA